MGFFKSDAQKSLDRSIERLHNNPGVPYSDAQRNLSKSAEILYEDNCRSLRNMAYQLDQSEIQRTNRKSAFRVIIDCIFNNGEDDE